MAFYIKMNRTCLYVFICSPHLPLLLMSLPPHVSIHFHLKVLSFATWCNVLSVIVQSLYFVLLFFTFFTLVTHMLFNGHPCVNNKMTSFLCLYLLLVLNTTLTTITSMPTISTTTRSTTTTSSDTGKTTVRLLCLFFIMQMKPAAKCKIKFDWEREISNLSESSQLKFARQAHSLFLPRGFKHFLLKKLIIITGTGDHEPCLTCAAIGWD